MKSAGENLSIIAVVVAKWSPSRMSDEIEAFCDCLLQIRMHQVFNKYGGALKEMDIVFREYSEDSDWPPEQLKSFADIDCGLDEEAVNCLLPLDL